MNLQNNEIKEILNLKGKLPASFLILQHGAKLWSGTVLCGSSHFKKRNNGASLYRE